MSTINPIGVAGPGVTGQFLGANTGSAPTWQIPSNPATACSFAASFVNLFGVTGDGTNYGINGYDSPIFNNGSNFNQTTGVFTAPSSGLYFLYGIVFLSSQAGGGLTWSTSLSVTSEGNVLGDYQPTNAKLPNFNGPNGWVSGQVTGIVNMTTGDTAQLFAQSSGGLANDNLPYGFFRGYKLT